MRKLALILLGLVMAISLHSCTNLTISEYKAKATATKTWRVEYFHSDKRSRFEEFSRANLTNVNGEKPKNAVGEPDDKGIWWPKDPKKPTIDEIEARQKQGEQHNRPEILRTVEYLLSYSQGGNQYTLRTNHSVYRQASKANALGKSLRLTLGVNDGSVEKAEPI